MSAVLSRRAALSGAVTSVAMVGAGVAGAAVVAPAAQVGVSPELLRLIAAVGEAEKAVQVHSDSVYDPVKTRHNAAVAEAEATLPHHSIDMGDALSGGGDRVIWSTANSRTMAMARTHVQMARDGGGSRIVDTASVRGLVAADLRRKRALERVSRSYGLDRLLDENNALNAAWVETIDAVGLFPAASVTDLHAKLTFMVENDMGNGVDWLPELLADATRLAKMEG